MQTAGSAPSKPTALTWAGVALVLPSFIFWLTILLGAVLHQDALSKGILELVKVFDVWFVIGVLLVMPLLGGILAAVGFHRRHLALSFVVIVLGFGFAALNLLMQSAPRPVH